MSKVVPKAVVAGLSTLAKVLAALLLVEAAVILTPYFIPMEIPSVEHFLQDKKAEFMVKYRGATAIRVSGVGQVSMKGTFRQWVAYFAFLISMGHETGWGMVSDMLHGRSPRPGFLWTRAMAQQEQENEKEAERLFLEWTPPPPVPDPGWDLTPHPVRATREQLAAFALYAWQRGILRDPKKYPKEKKPREDNISRIDEVLWDLLPDEIKQK